jgi:hypothetical protein
VKYAIDWSGDGGKSWRPVVADWRIIRRPPEPSDFWSQSFCWGHVELPRHAGPVQVRFRNSGRKAYRNVEAHLVYEVANPSPTRVTFAWDDNGATKTATRVYDAGLRGEDASWEIPAGAGVKTKWVEYAAQ